MDFDATRFNREITLKETLSQHLHFRRLTSL